MRREHIAQTDFQRVEIWKSAQVVEFRVAGAIHASFHRKRFMTGLVWDLIAAAALLRPKGEPRSILMLGLAGGTAFRTLRHLLPDCRFTAVDIDGGIIDLAREHMELDSLGIEVVIGDAYTWLARNKRKFDIVFDDIYLAGKTDVFRPQEWDGEIIKHLKRAVARDGLLGVNLVIGKGHRAMQSHTRRMLREEFPVTRSLTTPLSQNEVLIAGSEVATKTRLLPYKASFATWQDRDFWNLIEVAKLP
ncbi:MAG: methyltransferase domain-containing protein [Luteolibacter sp.]